MDALAETDRHRHAILDRHRHAILDRRGGKPLEVDLAEIIKQMREERDGELSISALGHRS